jgi:hypothetical protein
MSKQATQKIPFGPCYACDARGALVVGVRDRRPEGGQLEPACARHADPTIRAQAVCIYCEGFVRAGSLGIDGEYAHQAGHKDASR